MALTDVEKRARAVKIAADSIAKLRGLPAQFTTHEAEGHIWRWDLARLIATPSAKLIAKYTLKPTEIGLTDWAELEALRQKGRIYLTQQVAYYYTNLDWQPNNKSREELTSLASNAGLTLSSFTYQGLSLAYDSTWARMLHDYTVKQANNSLLYRLNDQIKAALAKSFSLPDGVTVEMLSPEARKAWDNLPKLKELYDTLYPPTPPPEQTILPLATAEA